MISTLQLEEIHTSLINGQRAQAVEQIEEYGPAGFFRHFREYLAEFGGDTQTQYKYFADAWIAYTRSINT